MNIYRLLSLLGICLAATGCDPSHQNSKEELITATKSPYEFDRDTRSPCQKTSLEKIDSSRRDTRANYPRVIGTTF